MQQLSNCTSIGINVLQPHERQRDLRVARPERKTWKGSQDLGILQRSPYWPEEKALAEHAN
eukprot:9487000-Heterocapsa_arctica.AAC.1